MKKKGREKKKGGCRRGLCLITCSEIARGLFLLLKKILFEALMEVEKDNSNSIKINLPKILMQSLCVKIDLFSFSFSLNIVMFCFINQSFYNTKTETTKL